MQCKYHPDRKAEVFCTTCNAPLCRDCAEEVKPGVYTCFQCGMLQSVSEVGTSLGERQKRAAGKKGKKKKWGPFQYFVIVSSVLILVMWGVILFGGQPAPGKTSEFVKKGRVFLFMVDGAIKHYARDKNNRYPERLLDLIPKYLYLRESERHHLDKLSYETDARVGYRLSLAKPEAGMNVILSAKGLEYKALSGEGAK
jgi:hypothetical protein